MTAHIPTAFCPFCHQVSSRTLRARDTNQPSLVDERFDYYRCQSCEVWFLHPVPPDLQSKYPAGYYGLPGVEEFEKGIQAEAYKVNLLRPFRRGGSLLEIGPACGYFAGAARNAGYDVSVIEMDPTCCAHMRDRLGIIVHESSDIAGVLKDLSRFDVIALWHVIEHLPDPWAVLRAAVDRLASGGILALATPNPGALQFRLLGSRWTHLDAPRHVYLLPLQHVVSFLTGLGLNVREATSVDDGSLYWNTYGWEHSLAHLVSRGQRFVRPVGRGVARLLAPLETKGQAGSAYTILAGKP